MNATPEVFSDIRFKFRNSDPVYLSGRQMTEDDFYEFCHQNPELRIERDQSGQIIIMPPTGSETGNRNSEIHIELGIWNRKHQLGKTFDSSTGFKLSNGADRSPDTAWITNERWAEISVKDKRRFAPIVPDFIVELRSEDQNLLELREKMDEYMACGCRLAWLIDPQSRQTYVYAEHESIQTVPFEDWLTGGQVLPGFELRLADLF